MPSPRRVLDVATAAARDAVTWRPGRQTSEDTYLAVRRLHRLTGGASSRAALRVVRTIHDRPNWHAHLDPLWASALDDVRRDGICRLPRVLDDDAVARLRGFASTAPAVLRTVTNGRAHGTFARRDETTAAVKIVERFVLDQSDVQYLMASPELLDFARAYLGATPVVHPPSLYWSCAGARTSPEAAASSARLFHWDYDGLRGMRVHLYLTDVDEEAAPMSYLRGSHRQGGLRTRALRHGDLGVPDEVAWSAYGPADEDVVTGPAGTMFASDSQGLHRGNDAISRDRLFLVLPIQATGFAGYQLRPRSVTPVDAGFRAGLERGDPALSLFRARPPDGSR